MWLNSTPPKLQGAVKIFLNMKLDSRGLRIGLTQLREKAPQSSVKLSVATILWGKTSDIPSFRTVLTDIKDLGFSGVGFETRFLPAELKRNPVELPAIVEGTGLENSGSYSSMAPRDVEWAAKSRTPLLWVVVRREKKVRDAIRTLSKFAKLARDHSIIPALHNHLGTCFETEEELDQALEEVDGLKICYDTAHAEAVGIDQKQFIKKYRDVIALVHLKDLRKKVPKSRVSFTKDLVNVGLGIVDFQNVLSSLIEYRYDGPLMLELDAAIGKKPGRLAAEGLSRVAELLSQVS
jgi:sugar phosphate isomerase/epimerase